MSREVEGPLHHIQQENLPTQLHRLIVKASFDLRLDDVRARRRQVTIVAVERRPCFIELRQVPGAHNCSRRFTLTNNPWPASWSNSESNGRCWRWHRSA